MLDYLVSPYNAEEFLSKYWERHPLVIPRGQPKYYQSLFSLRYVDEYLQRKDICYPLVKLVKDGEELPRSLFLRHSQQAQNISFALIDTDKLFHEYIKGATIVMDGLHRYSPALGRLCSSLEKELCNSLQTNIYLTPAFSQGFSAHWDTHDVMILQIHGSKQWRIYDSPIALPTNRQKFKKSNWQRVEPSFEIKLEAGDFLYIPRGFIHEANSTEQESLHITVGLIAITVGSLFNKIAENAHEDVYFRKTIPKGAFVAGTGQSKFCEEVQAQLCDFVGRVHMDSMLREVFLTFLSKRHPDAVNRLVDLSNINKVSTGTTLRIRPGIIFDLECNSDAVVLAFYGKKVTLPFFLKSLMKQIIDKSEFKLDALTTGLDKKGRLVLAKRLLREGFLEIVDAMEATN